MAKLIIIFWVKVIFFILAVICVVNGVINGKTALALYQALCGFINPDHVLFDYFFLRKQRFVSGAIFPGRG
ncbi:hypothetical protein ACP26C_02185 [Franconibacter helveticus 513]|uniref:hypothetical protein n=1 Tax=Franconibacter helveticus TaxID=357240 RepID=UPI0013964881|nr:hypothetical protein [Franconibacter helveticus]MDU6924536.1 hypothetical protein [Franconibacter helveticus]